MSEPASPAPSAGADAPLPWFDRTAVLVCALLGALTWLPFRQVLDADFVNYDDPQYVTDNPHVRAGLSAESARWAFTTTEACNWHPLTWLSLQLDYELFGLRPWGYHLTNVLLHIANTLLLFLVFRRMTGAVWRSAVVAGLFGLHPLHVESVAWVAERKDVLSTFFGLLALAAYLGYVRRPGVLRYLPVLLALALSLMAKPMLVTLPAVLLLLDYWPLGRLRPRGEAAPVSRALVLGEKVPLLALAAASCVMTVYAQAQGGAVEALEKLPLGLRCANAVVSYVRYLGMALWPGGLAGFYPHPRQALPAAQVAAAAALLAGLTALALAAARRRPYLAVGWLWYLGTLVPVIGLVQVGPQALADRYTYVPLIGLFLALVWGGADLLEGLRCPRGLSAGVAAALLGACLLGTWRQAGLWHDSGTLWRHALAVNPDNYLAHDALGAYLWKRGERTEALAHCAEAVRLNPDFADARFNLSVALAARGQADEAVEQVRQAVRLKPRHAPAQHNLGVALWARGALDEAAEHLAAAVAVDPTYASAWHYLGVVRAQQGRLDDAVACQRCAVELRPGEPRYHCGLAFALAEQGQREEAEAHYREALRLDPTWPQAFSRAAWALATRPEAPARNGAAALLLARQACAAPGGPRPEALDALAAALAEAGHFEEAARTAGEAAAAARARGLTDLASGAEQRQRLYQARRPYRQAPGSEGPGP
jgi:tetratricopeptide (TPR) repeat protein